MAGRPVIAAACTTRTGWQDQCGATITRQGRQSRTLLNGMGLNAFADILQFRPGLLDGQAY